MPRQSPLGTRRYWAQPSSTRLYAFSLRPPPPPCTLPPPPPRQPRAALTCSPRPPRRGSWSLGGRVGAPRTPRGRRSARSAAAAGGARVRSAALRTRRRPTLPAEGGGRARARRRGLGGRGRRARICSRARGGPGSPNGNASSPAALCWRAHQRTHQRARLHTSAQRPGRGCLSEPSPCGTRLGDTNAEASVKEKSQRLLEGAESSSHPDWNCILLHLGIFTGNYETPFPQRGSQVRVLGF